jgi:hypothetical protein
MMGAGIERQAAGTIAALANLVAIGIKDAIAKINLGEVAGSEHEQLIKANATMAICPLGYCFCVGQVVLFHTIKDHKIIA